jgi:hypothetical protein
VCVDFLRCPSLSTKKKKGHEYDIISLFKNMITYTSII